MKYKVCMSLITVPVDGLVDPTVPQMFFPLGGDGDSEETIAIVLLFYIIAMN